MQGIISHFRYVLAGLVAGGRGCGKEGLPGIYASVEENLCFIHWATKCKAGHRYESYYWYPQCDDWIDSLKLKKREESAADELRNSCVAEF